MKKTQPRIDWLECDRCGITLDSRNSPKNGSIATNCNGLDHLGMAVGKGESHDFDFCDSCFQIALDALDSIFPIKVKE